MWVNWLQSSFTQILVLISHTFLMDLQRIKCKDKNGLYLSCSLSKKVLNFSHNLFILLLIENMITKSKSTLPAKRSHKMILIRHRNVSWENLDPKYFYKNLDPYHTVLNVAPVKSWTLILKNLNGWTTIWNSLFLALPLVVLLLQWLARWCR